MNSLAGLRLTTTTMSTVSSPSGSPATKTVAAVSPNTAPVKQTAAVTKAAAAPTTVQSVTVVSVVEQTDSFIALAPAPTETQQAQPSSVVEPTQSTPQSTVKPQQSETPISTTSKPPAESRPTPVPAAKTQTTFETLVQTIAGSLTTTIKSSSASSSPSLVPLSNGSPFPGSNDQDAASPKAKNSGSTVAGVVGGLSAAILLGVLGFFLWKWKKRGKYGSNKRQSFGPYGNGIDANRGGLLVSSVGKPNDSRSNHEESLFSDDNSPTRYDRPSFDLNREPTLPSVGDLSDRPKIPALPPKTAQFGMGQKPSPAYPGQMSYRPQDPMMTVAGVAPLIGRVPVRQPGGGVLYEPRRPPIPPSMRRNRSPPQPPGALVAPTEDGDYMSGGSQNVPRSNSLGGLQQNRSLPSLPYGPPGTGRMPMRQVRRSNSVSGNDAARAQGGSGFDPLSMHPVIPEVPSGPTTPVARDMSMAQHQSSTLAPSNSITKSPIEMHRGAAPTTFGSPTTRPAPADRWSTLTTDSDKPKVLTIRNPSPDREKEKESSGIGSIVRRVSNMRHDREPTVKPEMAARNF
jgi:hypothetical protein